MPSNGFEKVVFIPANFHLSERAAAMLRELTELASQDRGRTTLPAIFWAEEYDEIKRRVIVHGVSTGWYAVDELPARLVQQVDGVSLAFLVTPRHAPHFQGRTIDFQETKFVLTP
ncbi:hypothetical protein [Bradyrhizobium sp. STM 3809]|uniref:hypothetical protein n=1 Tax=Bradyrhizobium sp. STM 3809 TaxID=551936 RepID=UPI0002408304|nr:hypothetical protein [Bradyrhizobium sp. STM 3809]CCE03888.1 hypothetical protein BRAS3809_870001 [Bradyrhizobium sp. STM 3809]